MKRKTIHKYELYPSGPRSMPKDAKILTVAAQDDRLFLWAEVDPDEKAEIRYFEVYGTGHDLTENEKAYIGTVFMGEFVWHVYETF